MRKYFKIIMIRKITNISVYSAAQPTAAFPGPLWLACQDTVINVFYEATCPYDNCVYHRSDFRLVRCRKYSISNSTVWYMIIWRWLLENVS